VYLGAKVGTHFLHVPDPKWKYDPNRSNLALDGMYDGPMGAKLVAQPPASGELLAWDPVNHKAAWRVKNPTVENGGVLATAGNLVFQGRGDGVLAAYRATDGKELWKFDAGTGIMAPPVTYTSEGVQYLTVMAGWGGAPGSFNAPGGGPTKHGYGRILTFALNGTTVLKPPPYGHKDPPPAPAITSTASPKVVHEGNLLFNGNCGPCHGINAVAGPNPDLRYSSKEIQDDFENIVLGGSRASAGMPSFKNILNAEQVRAIQAYILARARESSGAK
jgi:quinohemoprotein ethanol dehydrogenase